MTLFIVLANAAVGMRDGFARSPQEEWEAADRLVTRLAPRAFPNLPANLLQELERRGCRVPQSYAGAGRHNVIRGEFAKRGQTDWAVLCSVERVSSILVFWNGSQSNPAELARSPDRNWLQTIGGGKIGFSRIIRAVNRKFILDHNSASGGPAPPPVDHEGIEDAFAEKGSSVHYFHQQQWIELAGTD